MIFKHLMIFVQLDIILVNTFNDYKSYEGYKVYDICPSSLNEQNHLWSLSLLYTEIDFWSMSRQLGRMAEAMVPPYFQNEFEAELHAFNISYTVSVDNVEEIVQKERILQDFSRMFEQRIDFNRYYRYEEICDYLESLVRKYPDLVTVTTIGQSYEKKDIKMIRINKNSIRGKNKLLIDAGIHAREWIAPATALYIIQQLVDNSSENLSVLDNLDWYIIPIINPDGYEYTHTKERFWRKTRKPSYGCIGTDGNRNFDFHWCELGSSSYPCSETFCGDSAFSEPEIMAVRDVMHSMSKTCKFYLSLHAYGNYMLYPWGYTQALPNNWQDINDVAESGASAIRKLTGTQYTVGTCSNVLYTAAGISVDYALGVVKIPISITMELPGGGSGGLPGFDPLPNKIREIVEESWVGIKAMALSVDKKFKKINNDLEVF